MVFWHKGVGPIVLVDPIVLVGPIVLIKVFKDTPFYFTLYVAQLDS